jgi:glycosyltransferase EpsD
MLKVLFVATVMSHFKSFHLPYMQWFKEQGWEVHAAANGKGGLPFCDKEFVIPLERSPLKINNLKIYMLLMKILRQEPSFRTPGICQHSCR